MCVGGLVSVQVLSAQKARSFSAPEVEAAAPLQQGLVVSEEDAQEIGRKVWVNEAGGKVSALTHWNKGETFASLGIGHFIWYPAGQEGPFDESFPKMLAFVSAQGAKLPQWLSAQGDCPWPDIESFQKDLDSPRMIELRTFLADTVPLQARFLALRLEEALPKILAAAPVRERTLLQARFYRTASSGSTGLYALMDYVNFKGEGVKETERYNGQGWGLLQALEGMKDCDPGPLTLKSFADSAAAALARRVKNSPPERSEARWLPGWLKRIDTYRR
jgi:hypothetical protein